MHVGLGTLTMLLEALGSVQQDREEVDAIQAALASLDAHAHQLTRAESVLRQG